MHENLDRFGIRGQPVVFGTVLAVPNDWLPAPGHSSSSRRWFCRSPLRTPRERLGWAISSGSEIGPIRSGQNSPGPVTTGQRASRRAARSSRKRGVTLFRVSPNVTPGWCNTLVPVENTEPIPVPEPMLPIPGPAYTSPTPRSTPSSPPYVPGDLPANPDEVYMVWLRGVVPSEWEEAAIVKYTRWLESGEEVQRELVVPEE